METQFFTGTILVKCMKDPLYGVVIGNIPEVMGIEGNLYTRVGESEDQQTRGSVAMPRYHESDENTIPKAIDVVGVGEERRASASSGLKFGHLYVTRGVLKTEQEQDHTPRTSRERLGVSFII